MHATNQLSDHMAFHIENIVLRVPALYPVLTVMTPVNTQPCWSNPINRFNIRAAANSDEQYLNSALVISTVLHFKIITKSAKALFNLRLFSLIVTHLPVFFFSIAFFQECVVIFALLSELLFFFQCAYASVVTNTLFST